MCGTTGIYKPRGENMIILGAYTLGRRMCGTAGNYELKVVPLDFFTGISRSGGKVFGTMGNYEPRGGPLNFSGPYIL